MHVGPADFRSVRRDGVALQFALLGEVGFVLADFPVSGSRGTFAEAPCELPHWGFVVDGDVVLETDDARHAIPVGTAFHIPAGMTHRFAIPGRSRLAGFERVREGADTTDAGLREAGYDVIRQRSRAATDTPLLEAARPYVTPAAGEITTVANAMGDWLFMRTRFGRRAGYTGGYCDVPHWGLVTSGSLAVESEDAVEVITAGDVYAVPAGPPGHRMLAAEPASVVDFTPIASLRAAARIAGWRIRPADAALAATATVDELQVAQLG